MDVLSLLKETVQGVISGHSAVPEEKKGAAISTATGALAEGFRNNLSLDNIGELASLFGGGSTNVSKSNPVVSNIISTVVQALISKVGLNKGTADKVGSSVVQTVIKALSGKASDPREKGIDLESIIGTFTGGGNTKTQGGGNILDTIGSLGKMFGK